MRREIMIEKQTIPVTRYTNLDDARTLGELYEKVGALIAKLGVDASIHLYLR